MRVDLLNSMLWEDFNEKLKAGLDFGLGGEAETQIRAYPGIAPAMSEVVLGTSLFFSHKKTVAVVQGETWAFESVLPHLYKQGFQVIEVKSHQISNWQDWVAQLPKDVNFVLWAEDHPVTGEFYSREDLDEALNARRIYSIRMSHSAHHYHPRKLGLYSVRICSYGNEVVVAHCGARFRTPPLFVHRQLWNDSKLMLFQTAMATETQLDEAAIKNFETYLTQTDWGFEAFPFSGNRLWDRSVIFNSSLNSEAVLTELIGTGQLKYPGFELRAEAVNSCRWTFQPELRTWWDPLPDELILRGLLVLDAALIREPGFVAKMAAAVAKAR